LKEIKENNFIIQNNKTLKQDGLKENLDFRTKTVEQNIKLDYQILNKEHQISHLEKKISKLEKALSEKVDLIEKLESKIIDLEIKNFNDKLHINSNI
jgi:predicted RNase H-like nuclease (RuvC/YqgF family)